MIVYVRVRRYMRRQGTNMSPNIVASTILCSLYCSKQGLKASVLIQQFGRYATPATPFPISLPHRGMAQEGEREEALAPPPPTCFECDTSCCTRKNKIDFIFANYMSAMTADTMSSTFKMYSWGTLGGGGQIRGD